MSKLSQPVNFKDLDLEDMIDYSFINFNDIFINKKNRPLYKGRFIFFDVNCKFKNFTLSKPERFLHIISIENRNEYKIYPCNNDMSYAMCPSKCSINKALLEFKIINRVECIYRLSRIHWIPEIIMLANDNDANIMQWLQSTRNEKGNIIYKQFIRYECGIDDYIIILEDDKKKGIYRFITAFPIFLKRHKTQYAKAYMKYKKT
jgi:hypothetical protein